MRSRVPGTTTVATSAMPCPIRIRTDDLAAEYIGAVSGAAVPEQPVIEDFTILVSHDRYDVAVPGLASQRHETAKLSVVRALDLHAGMRGALRDQLVDLPHGPTTQIVLLVDDLHHIGTQGSELQGVRIHHPRDRPRYRHRAAAFGLAAECHS